MIKNFIRVILIISSLFFFSNNAYSHGGEDHNEENKKTEEVFKNKQEDNSPIKLERIINIKSGSFRLTLEQTPKIVYQDEIINFKFSLIEIIENSFIEPENIKLKDINISSEKLKTIEFKIENNNIYTFKTNFSKSSNIYITALDENGNKFQTEFKINVISVPINYFSYTIIFIIIFTLTILNFLFFKRSKILSQRLYFSFICIIIAFLSIFLIKYFLPLRFKITVQEKENIEDLNTLNVNIPKETQLLFNINTQIVKKQSINNTINIIGTVKTYPQSTVDIITPVSGKVFIKTLKLGQKVSKNEDLGYMEQTLSLPDQLSVKTTALDLKLKILELESKIKNSKNKYNTSIKEYNRAKIDYGAKKQQLNKEIEKISLNLNLAKKEYSRVKELFDSGSASLKRLQESENSVKVLNSEIEVLKKQNIYTIGSEVLKRLRETELQVKLDDQELKSAKNQISQISKLDISNEFKIISPIDGIITQINTSYGNQEEANKLIINISGTNKMLIEGEVFENDISQILKSKTGEFTVVSYPDEVFKIDNKQNKFVTIGNSVDLDKRTIPVIFEIDNKSNKFKEGMFANISLNIFESSQNIVIPKNSVFEDNGKSFVYVYHSPEIFEKREIKINNQSQENISILEGLKIGERIAIQGIYQINSAMIGKK